MHHYQLYKLKVTSFFPIKGIPEIQAPIHSDVILKPGKLTWPKEEKEMGLNKPDSIAREDLYFLELEDIARYQINSKNEVIIDISDSSTEQDAMVFFFDTILTILLLKHHLFVLHAAAIMGKEGAILICAPAGGGKSALTMSLLKKGYEFIEDDRCLLHWDEADQQIKIQNYLPFVDLWKDVQSFAEDFPKLKLLHQIRPGIQKYRYDASKMTLSEEIPVSQIICINVDNLQEEIKQTTVMGIAKCKVGIAHTHLNHLIQYVSDPHKHFSYLLKTLSNVTMTRIVRSRNIKLPTFSEYIHQLIETNSSEAKTAEQT